MKYYLASVCMAVCGLAFTGCSDLEERPLTFLNPGNFYNTEGEVDAALNGVYNRFRNMYTANSQMYLANIELFTEQGWPTYNKNSMELLNRWYDINNASTGNSDRGFNRIWSAAYEAINRANIVLARHQDVQMSDTQHNRIEGQAKFIRAYSLWHVIRLFGGAPVITTYTNGLEGLDVPRNTLDECFDYIVKSLDAILASGKLPDKIISEATELGRITNGIVRAVKAEVLIYAASPLFNGNGDYTNFTDNRGIEIFCPQNTDEQRRARWQAAAAACAEAIEFLEGQGVTLYKSQERGYTDATNYKLSIRGAVSEPWNSELIWGYTGTRTRSMQAQAIPRGLYSNAAISQGNASVPVQIAELFYTKNGVPVDEDVTWDYAGRFTVKTVPEADFALMKAGYETVKFNLDREYRYYADLAFDGNVWFGQGKTDESNPTYVQCKSLQPCSNVTLAQYNMTGIWPKKYVNPRTIVSTSISYVDYPWPVMRLAGLYLYYAEALNECGESYEKVLPYIDPIRERAGIPDVATSWDTYTNSPGKYKTQEGMRQIIHRERAIELCFEGHRFWDLRRWKEGYTAFNKAVTGWTLDERTADLYFSESLVFTQTFGIKDYFWPVPNEEIYANPNTVQNYGW